MTIHQPALLKEVIEYLDPQPGENFIDCTLGGGGHALAILNKTSPQGKLLGIDLDASAIARVKLKIKSEKIKIEERLILVNGSFGNLKDIYQKNFPYPVSGLLLDLGLSSDQLERSGRGFSFQRDEPLDMRFSGSHDGGQKLTARDIINKWPLSEIEKILRIYGEEDDAAEIAAAIVSQRKKQTIDTTFQLNSLILAVKGPQPAALGHQAHRLGFKARRVKKIFPTTGRRLMHPATRVFQALRMAVNSELEVLESVLPQAVAILQKDSCLAVISFHGLEDRLVKRFFQKQDQSNKLRLLSRKPILPDGSEVKTNPRARSARLRVAKKL